MRNFLKIPCREEAWKITNIPCNKVFNKKGNLFISYCEFEEFTNKLTKSSQAIM